MNSAAHKIVTRLRTWTIVEGVSYALLLFVAMPLKYLAGIPLAVRIVGMAHGVLFMIVGVLLLLAMAKARWSLGRAALVFVSTLVPFGPFFIERKMKAYLAEAAD